jgi:hypothetical protein
VKPRPKDGAFLLGETKGRVMRVEKAHIDKMVASLTFKFARIEDTTTTVCEAFLPNGFSVGSGKSACVDPNNFNYEDGCKYAKERCIQDATNTLWQLEGYLLKVTGSVSGVPVIKKSSRAGFCLYDSKPTVREAYKIRGDELIEMGNDNTGKITIESISYVFAVHEPIRSGDYIVFLNDEDVYHCNQKVFAERNIT